MNFTYSVDKVKEIKTTTYSVNNDTYKDFYVDIVDDGEKRVAWLWHKGYGLKSHIFGTSKDQDSLDHFMELIKGTINEDITFFVKEMDDYEAFCCERCDC